MPSNKKEEMRMADEKAKIVTDATGPGSGPASAQPVKQEQSAPEAPTPDKAEAPEIGRAHV